VISLKEELYNKASALIGVYPESTTPCNSSGILTFNLDSLVIGDEREEMSGRLGSTGS
jgi:hypothetical protein